MQGYDVQHQDQLPQQCGVVELTAEELELLVTETIELGLPPEPDEPDEQDEDELPAAA